jgi:signal peptidase I
MTSLPGLTASCRTVQTSPCFSSFQDYNGSQRANAVEVFLTIDPSENTPVPADPSAAQEPVKTGNAWGHFFLEMLQTIVLALVLYFLIDSVMARVRVENISMEPTLMPGEFILVNKVAYRLGDIHRGDIIVFHHTSEEDYIKRVVGIPGDTVIVRNSQVYVNNQMLDEPYLSAPPVYTGKWEVPENSLFVLGDNRNQSSDSHSWGYVPQETIVGKALLIYWPVNRLKVLNQMLTASAAVQP